jgi:hypothetical protein
LNGLTSGVKWARSRLVEGQTVLRDIQIEERLEASSRYWDEEDSFYIGSSSELQDQNGCIPKMKKG